jgi:hypothetical protein
MSVAGSAKLKIQLEAVPIMYLLFVLYVFLPVASNS